MNKTLLFFVALLLVLGGGLIVYRVMQVRNEPVTQGGDSSNEPIEPVKLTEFTLTERSGEPFHSKELEGEVWIAGFFYAGCPSHCAEQNRRFEQLQQEYGSRGLRLVSITVDPENDTPSSLRIYADRFNADPERWAFLTGEPEMIRQIGNQYFHLPIEIGTHSESMVPIDRDGHIRSYCTWQEPTSYQEMKDLIEVMLVEAPGKTAPTLAAQASESGEVSQEEAPEEGPNSEAPAIPEETDEPEHGSGAPLAPRTEPIDFALTERSGRTFHSQEFDNEVWVASFFFAKCPGPCARQNQAISQLQNEFGHQGVRFLSITIDPTNDTPSSLRIYADQFGADPEQWLFLTGNFEEIQEIASLQFGVYVAAGGHTEKLLPVDRDGNLRGQFSWQREDNFLEFKELLQVMIDEEPGATAPTLEAQQGESEEAEQEDHEEAEQEDHTEIEEFEVAPLSTDEAVGDGSVSDFDGNGVEIESAP